MRLSAIFLGLMLITVSAFTGCASVPGVPHVFTPSGKGPFPGVIVLHTKGGVTGHIVDYARSLSQNGYITAVVDFWAQGGVDNIAKGYDYLSTQPTLSIGRIGLVGFSRGSSEALKFSIYSHRFTERRIGAIVSYYIGPDVGSTFEWHPPILFLHGSLDVHVSPEQIKLFCSNQRKLGTLCEAEIYEGIKHAFDQPRSEYNGYDAATDSIAFKKALSFLDKYLKGVPVK